MKKDIHFLISDELYKRLKYFSDSESETITQTITTAIKERINKQHIPHTIEHSSIPLKIQQPIVDIQKTSTAPTFKKETIPQEEDAFKEHTLAELIMINYESLFITTQVIKIKEYLSTLTDEQLSELSPKLNDFKFDNKANPQKILNFISWADDILYPPHVATQEATEFFNEYKAFFHEKYRQETSEEFDKFTQEQQKIIKEEFDKGTKGEFLMEEGVAKKIDFKYEWLPSIKYKLIKEDESI